MNFANDLGELESGSFPSQASVENSALPEALIVAFYDSKGMLC